jgi:LmbE family N-acetylglucosaminyl deacetylase
LPLGDLEEASLNKAMLQLSLLDKPGQLKVLCLGAHSDDIEIGCAGTLLTWMARGYELDITWVVLSADGERNGEARCSAEALVASAASLRLILCAHKDSHFPSEHASLKIQLGELRRECSPDIIFTHSIEDRHQDHRLVGELTWQAWRDHLILEYEIPKYEGDLGRPSVFVPISNADADKKVDHLLRHFGTQRSKAWFSSDTFRALLRIRGIECNAPAGLAEAFVARKLVF